MKRLTILLGLILLMPGCVRSLHPFYIDSQLIYDPTVTGTWADEKNENTFVISGDAEHKKYSVLHTDEKKKAGRFEVHLAKVQDRFIADIAPAEPPFVEGKANDVYTFHLIPVHSFMLVTYNARSIKMRTISSDWFKKYIKEHPDAIKYERIDGDDDNLILTAPTDQLQAFLLKHISTEGAYGDTTELHWVSATTQP